MSTLSYQLENIENFDPDAAPDADERPVCPDCCMPLDTIGDHLECLNDECLNCSYYQIIDGRLTNVAPAF